MARRMVILASEDIGNADPQALTIAIAVTRTNGITVHTISSPVCPWIGGPSSKSSSATRKRATE